MNKRRKLNFKKAVIPCLTVLIVYMAMVQPVGRTIKRLTAVRKTTDYCINRYWWRCG